MMMWKWKFEGEAEEQGAASVVVGEAVTIGAASTTTTTLSSSSGTRWIPTPLRRPAAGAGAAVYKIAPTAHTAQSVLSAAACLIVLSLTNLWSYLHTLEAVKIVSSVCANYYQSVTTEASKLISLVARVIAANRGLPATATTTEGPNSVVDPVFLEKVVHTSTTGEVVKVEESVNMTIEVPAEYTPPPAALPVLRINSMSIELDNTQFLLSSSDGEDQERDHLVFTDGELSSSNEIASQNMVRRDSDTSDVSSTDGSTAEDQIGEPAPELTARIINQVESMFSDEHLGKDGFLLKHVRRRSDGFVSLKLVAGLRKVKQISREFPVILSALRKSEKLEVNGEGTKIRRVEPLTPYLKSLPIASQKNKEKEVLSKSPSSSGDEISGRNANGSCLHFPNGSPLNNGNCSDKENSNNNKRQNGRNGKVTRNNKESSQKQQQQEHHNNKQSPQKQSRSNSRDFSSNNSTSSMEREIILRRRGGSLPITMAPVMHGHGAANSHPTHPSYLSPNSSPPNNHRLSGIRPKSNSYCEGLMMTSTTMSPWLQRRKAASEGNVVISSVIRQPRGPDGTRGFSMLPRPSLITAN